MKKLLLLAGAGPHCKVVETAMKSIQSKIVITDENDENMIVSPFDSNCLINVNES